MDAIKKKMQSLKTETDNLYSQIRTFEEQTKTASRNPWEVSFSKISNSLNIFYKGDPICKVSAKKLGIPDSELNFVERFLPKKLASNEKLVKALLLELSDSAKNEVLSKYPELL